MYKLLRLSSKVILSNFNTLKEPYKITFAVTYRCNSKCKTCGIWKKKVEEELGIKEMERIFEKINPSWLNITGGEPFLRKDLYEIVRLASKRDIYLLNITTNGSLREKIINDVKKILDLSLPKLIVVVSLDGSREIHDNIRGIKGSWNRAIETFKELKILSEENKKLQVYFGYTISSYNINNIFETLKEIKEKTDISFRDFHFNIFHRSPLYYGESDGGDISNLKDRLMEDIRFILDKKKGLGAIQFIERRYLKNISKYLESNKSPLKCKALTSSCFIDPTGNVYPCTIFDKNLGNLKDFDYDFKKIWQSKKVDNIRKIIEKNKCPGCWTPCEAYQTILGNILKI